MTSRQRLACLIACLAGATLVAGVAADQAGAKILFYDPDLGQPSHASVKLDALTGLAPVRTRGTQFVGVHYWFENERGQKFPAPGAAGLGARMRMHLRGNAKAFLTVWLRDSSRDSVELTSRTHGGPEGRWSGYELDADVELVIPGEFEITTADRAVHIIFLLARSQTEQVQGFANCRAKLDVIAARKAADGESVLVREVDRTSPGQVGTYVVHRTGGQAGEEFSFAATGRQ
jgi:hypothetical protein